MSGEGIIFLVLYIFKTLRKVWDINRAADLIWRPEAPPTDFVDLEQGHRETAILSACIRRQLPFVGNVWIFKRLYCTESSKILLCIKLLQCLKLSYKSLIKKKISKFHMAPRCSSAWSPVSPFPLTRKRKKGIWKIPFTATILILLHPVLQTKVGASCTVWAQVCSPIIQHLQIFSGNLLQAGGEKE